MAIELTAPGLTESRLRAVRPTGSRMDPHIKSGPAAACQEFCLRGVHRPVAGSAHCTGIMRIYPPNLADHLAVGLVAWIVPAAGDAAVSLTWPGAHASVTVPPTPAA